MNWDCPLITHNMKKCSGVWNVWRAGHLLTWGCGGQGWSGGDKSPQLSSLKLLSVQVIIEVNDCALNLMGESQEEDRKKIAEMVLKQMEEQCVPVHTNGVAESELNSAAENPVERSGEGEKKVKSLPGPVQRGPQRRISSSQGGTPPLLQCANINLTHSCWLHWPSVHSKWTSCLFLITFHADSYDSTG